MDAATDSAHASVKQFVEVCSECLLNWLVLMRYEPESLSWAYLRSKDSQCPHCGGQPKEAL